MENTINDLISKYRDIHSHLMDEYSKGNANNEIMQMYRSRMSSILGFISDLKRLGEFESVRPEVVVPKKREINYDDPIMFQKKDETWNICIDRIKSLNPTLTFTELNHTEK